MKKLLSSVYKSTLILTLATQSPFAMERSKENKAKTSPLSPQKRNEQVNLPWKITNNSHLKLKPLNAISAPIVEDGGKKIEDKCISYTTPQLWTLKRKSKQSDPVAEIKKQKTGIYDFEEINETNIDYFIDNEPISDKIKNNSNLIFPETNCVKTNSGFVKPMHPKLIEFYGISPLVDATKKQGTAIYDYEQINETNIDSFIELAPVSDNTRNISCLISPQKCMTKMNSGFSRPMHPKLREHYGTSPLIVDGTLKIGDVNNKIAPIASPSLPALKTPKGDVVHSLPLIQNNFQKTSYEDKDLCEVSHIKGTDEHFQGPNERHKTSPVMNTNGLRRPPKISNSPVNKGWNKPYINKTAFSFESSQNVQNIENIIVEPSLETISQGASELQKSPEVICTNGFFSSPKDKAVNSFITKGWKQMHPDLTTHYSMNSQIVPKSKHKYPFADQKNNEQKKEPYQSKAKIISVTSSSDEKSEISSSEDDFIGSSNECSIKSGEDDYCKKSPIKRTFKRLKKKNQIRYEDSSSSSDTTSSTTDSEDSSTESTLSTTDSDSSSEDEPSTPSIDEDYQSSRKGHRFTKGPIVTTRSSNKPTKRKYSNSPSFTTAVESEEEDDFSHKIIPYPENNEHFDLVTTMGTRLKLLSNVYLANLESRPNIFLPHYTLEVEHPEGTFEIKSFFETPKGEICVFASGGVHHIWEKNIEHIYELFFGQKVKIIRSRWMQKHLKKDRNIERNLEEEFHGKEHELHSEFYYDLFFRHFFAQELARFAVEEKEVSLKSLTIHAFSNWDVCDGCEDLLSKHNPPEEANFVLSYKIAARKRYSHAYPHTSIVEEYALHETAEEKVWKEIWGSLKIYIDKPFKNDEEKEIFWTKTKDGLEICKWLGQGFRETNKGLDGKAKVIKKGDVLAFYKSMQPNKDQALEDLLSYLHDRNWDLSCWYLGPNFPSGTQAKWKRHWKQQIVPHFGWEEVNDFKIEDKESSDHCEMCGKTNLMNVHLVFHPKFHVSNKFLSLPEEDQKLRERDYDFTYESAFPESYLSLKQKRKQSIRVGSDCVHELCLSREVIEDWHDRNPEAEKNTKWEVDRLASYDVLDMAEKNLKALEKKRRKK